MVESAHSHSICGSAETDCSARADSKWLRFESCAKLSGNLVNNSPAILYLLWVVSGNISGPSTRLCLGLCATHVHVSRGQLVQHSSWALQLEYCCLSPVGLRWPLRWPSTVGTPRRQRQKREQAIGFMASLSPAPLPITMVVASLSRDFPTRN